MALAPSGFLSPQVRPLFGRFSLGPPLGKSQKMADFGCSCEICHNAALRALLEPPFAPQCCPMSAFDGQSYWQIMAFAPSGFLSPQVRPLFDRFALGPPLAKSQKMADLGALAKFVITEL